MKLLILRFSAIATLLAIAAFGQQAPRLYSNDGKGVYLGKLSANKWDPDSISNPWGQYGSTWSEKSVNNSWGEYGSKWSPYSATNPWTTLAPVIIGDPSSIGSLPALPALPSLSTTCCSDWS